MVSSRGGVVEYTAVEAVLRRVRSTLHFADQASRLTDSSLPGTRAADAQRLPRRGSADRGTSRH